MTERFIDAARITGKNKAFQTISETSDRLIFQWIDQSLIVGDWYHNAYHERGGTFDHCFQINEANK